MQTGAISASFRKKANTVLKVGRIESKISRGNIPVIAAHSAQTLGPHGTSAFRADICISCEQATGESW